MRLKWLAQIILLFVAWLSGTAGATVYVLPLHDGKVRVGELNAAISDQLHTVSLPTFSEVDLNGPDGADFLCAVNACLWRGCSLEAAPTKAILRLEPPGRGVCQGMRRMTRIIAAERAPAATAAQARRWGLSFPQRIDPRRPLVVLIHGLDADRNDCMPMGDLLHREGYQVAYFAYPGDEPIDDSAALCAKSMKLLHDRFPQMRVELVCHSMGGLVARQYIEGPQYAGGVDKLIMVATPNGGSSWAHLSTALSVQEHYYLRADPDWNWTWLITEGMGEAGDDLLPGSDFLKQLTERPRRDGVKYTIIAGNKSGVDRVGADVADSVATWVPVRARTWWVFGHCYRELQAVATHLRDKTSDGDGPVSLESAKLKGVKDVVILPADHRTLFLPDNGKPPVAWAVVMDRLRR